jgi:hypothetical protein
VQGSAFTSAIVLLLKIWGGKPGGAGEDTLREMKDVYTCMDVLKRAESKCGAVASSARGGAAHDTAGGTSPGGCGTTCGNSRPSTIYRSRSRWPSARARRAARHPS